MPDRVYAEIRSLVKRLGGSMTYERKGFRYGAWVIRIGARSVVIEAGGDRSFPELDRLHEPKSGVREPSHWDDFEAQLLPDAETRLLSLLDNPQKRPDNLTPNESHELADLVGRAKWRFAWTLARTYPHEYTTKKLCSLEDHARLIDCIERCGVVEPFGMYQHKYLYLDGRKYWHMGDPYSADPAQWPNVINRTWVDVRRHAQNVRHVWTPEEIDLQMRLWEIQIEKATDRAKSAATPG